MLPGLIHNNRLTAAWFCTSTGDIISGHKATLEEKKERVRDLETEIEEYEAERRTAVGDERRALLLEVITATRKIINILLQKEQQKEQQQQCNVMRPVPPLHCTHDHHR